MRTTRVSPLTKPPPNQHSDVNVTKIEKDFLSSLKLPWLVPPVLTVSSSLYCEPEILVFMEINDFGLRSSYGFSVNNSINAIHFFIV